MLDRDLAELYGVETKVLNQAVKRDIERFPDEFCFQLNMEEAESCSKSQIVTSSWGGRRKPSYAFTEQGVAMLSAVLRSETEIYHIGASLKDLGKKCFGFTRLEETKLMIKTVMDAV